MKFSFIASSITAAAAMMMCLSCVNEEYDLSKEIDKDITLLKGISLPVGNIEKISLMQVLEIEESENSVISTDNDGNLFLSFTGDAVKADIEMPELTLADGNEIKTEPVTVVFNTGGYKDRLPSAIQGNIVYSETAGKIVDKTTDIIIDSELPEQVVDIRSIDLDANLEISFTVSSDAVHLVKGLELIFPDDVTLTKNDNNPSYALDGIHKVVVKEDVKVTSSSPLIFHLKIKKIDVPSGSVFNGRIYLDEVLHVKADFFLDPSDFTKIPEKISIDIDANITALEVLSAEVKLDINEEIEGTEINIGELPDFLSGEDSFLDIYNPSIRFSVENSSPLSIDVTAEVSASRNGSSTAPVRLGYDDRITIPGSSSVDYVISRREGAASEGENEIVIPDIINLINPLPESISVDGIRVKSSNDSYVSLSTDGNYSASIEYEVDAPLAFGSGLRLSFIQDIEDIGLEFEGMDIPSATISMNLINSIPIGFSLTANALDSDGNVIEDITLSTDKPIAPGSLASPTENNIVITLKNKGDELIVSGLRIALSASSNEDFAGITLNTGQGIEIRDMAFALPEGINMNLNEM